jgi:CBS domain-containing protein
MKKNTIKAEERELLSQKSEVLNRVTSFRYNEALREIMERDVYLCGTDDTITSVATDMARLRISSAIVTDKKNRPVGIVTERDIVQKVVAEDNNHPNKLISDIMTPEPVFLSPDDTLFDALAVTSRYSIKHLPVVESNRVVGIITFKQLMKLQHSEPLVIIGLLEEATSIDDYKEVKDSMVDMVNKRLHMNVDPVDIVTMVSLINADIHKRLFMLALGEQNSQPPVDFCLFVSGSHGRRENLLFPDQDYGLIIDDYDDAYYNEYDMFFIRTAQTFSDYLDQVGFDYCSGNVMGTNPTWRKRRSEWGVHLRYWFERQPEYTVRYMTLLFDAMPLYGEFRFFKEIQDQAFREIAGHYDILRQMHEEEGGHKVPLGIFDRFITERNSEHRGQLDMKRSGLIFMIEAARILAVKKGIRETSTMARLRALADKKAINKNDSEYFENAYRIILHHTLMAQVDNFRKKATNDYYLSPRELSARSQEMLKQSFKAISRLQELVGSEFGELIL